MTSGNLFTVYAHDHHPRVANHSSYKHHNFIIVCNCYDCQISLVIETYVRFLSGDFITKHVTYC